MLTHATLKEPPGEACAGMAKDGDIMAVAATVYSSLHRPEAPCGIFQESDCITVNHEGERRWKSGKRNTHVILSEVA